MSARVCVRSVRAGVQGLPASEVHHVALVALLDQSDARAGQPAQHRVDEEHVYVSTRLVLCSACPCASKCTVHMYESSERERVLLCVQRIGAHQQATRLIGSAATAAGPGMYSYSTDPQQVLHQPQSIY